MVISGPEFLIATLLVMLFAIELRWVPAVSYLSQDPTFQQIARAMFLPVMTLVFAVLAPMTRMTRSAVWAEAATMSAGNPALASNLLTKSRVIASAVLRDGRMERSARDFA